MKNILEFDSLDLRFDGRRILSGTYIKCQQGEVVGLLGRNGSGKSSLMKVVFGTLGVEHKSVRVNDIALEGDYNRKTCSVLWSWGIFRRIKNDFRK
jgi:lipopolysaccharide export system ATP-binding protein